MRMTRRERAGENDMKKTTVKKEAIALVSKEKEAAYFKKVMKHKEAQEAYDEAGEYLPFVNQIRALMEKKHLTNYTLARKAGVKPQEVLQFFNNIGDTEILTIFKIVRGLGKRLEIKFVKIRKKQIRVKIKQQQRTSNQLMSLKIAKI